VHQLLADKGIEIDRRRIELREPIKEIGEFKVTIRVGQDISTLVSLTVKPLGGELEDLSVDGEPESVAEPAPEAAQPEAVDDSDKD
jgi:hypothetical protein